MQKYLLLCVLLVYSQKFQSINSKSISRTSFEGSLKILTWNVQMVPRVGAIFSSSLRKMQEERTKWIIEHIEHSNHDIILLQECFDRGFIEELLNRLKNQYPFAILPIHSNWYKLSNGLLVLSKYKLDKVDHVFFNRLSNVDFFTAKGAVLAKVILDTQYIYIVNTHLQADYDKKKYCKIRQEQLQSIHSNLVKKYVDSVKDKIIVAGDLNIEENIHGTEYSALLHQYKWKDWVYDFFRSPSLSFDKGNYWNKDCKQSCRLDYFLANFTSQVFKICIEKPKKRFGKDEIDLADHYGISADFSLLSVNE